jgi:RNA polymerase sigma-70 factor (ECF subfamily)
MSKGVSKIPQPDAGLIESCVKGDVRAFRILVEKLQTYAYTLAFRILLNDAEAKDAVQDSFIKVWIHLGNYNGKYLFTTWMYRIVVNTCIDRLKEVKRHSEIYSDCISDSDNPEDSTINRELAKQIRQLSKGLPQKQRIIFVLNDLQGLSLDEASEVLNMPKGLVKSNLYYARKSIKEKLLKTEEWRSYEIVR